MEEKLKKSAESVLKNYPFDKSTPNEKYYHEDDVLKAMLELSKSDEVSEYHTKPILEAISRGDNLSKSLKFDDDDDEITESFLIEHGFESNQDEHEEEWYHKDEDLFGFKFTIFAGSAGSDGFAHIWDGAFTNAPCEKRKQIKILFHALTGKELIRIKK